MKKIYCEPEFSLVTFSLKEAILSASVNPEDPIHVDDDGNPIDFDSMLG